MFKTIQNLDFSETTQKRTNFFKKQRPVQTFKFPISDDLVYVFYLAVAFFVGCGVVMLPIPSLMKKLQPAKVDQNGNNNNNRGDCELES